MGGILPAAALSQTDGLPVGRPVTDPGKASAFHERFYQHRAIAVTGLPIGGQAVERLGQAMGCQIGHLQMIPDEKTALVDHAVQMFGSHNVAPTQPLIAGCQAPGGGAEGQPAEITVRAGDEVTQLRATERTSPQIMFLFEEFAPGAAQGAAAGRNQLQRHRTQLVEGTVPRRLRRGHRRARGDDVAPRRRRQGWGQMQVAGALEGGQGLAGGHLLPAPGGTFPIQPLTKQTGLLPAGQTDSFPLQALEQVWREVLSGHDHPASLAHGGFGVQLYASRRPWCPAL